MRDLSVFVDESGDFGPYEQHAAYYIVTLVFHDQAKSVVSPIEHFNRALEEIGFANHVVHAGPLIRREDVYKDMSVDERMRIFNRAFNFMRTVDISYKSFSVEKKHIKNALDLVDKLTKQIKIFLADNLDFFSEFDRVIIYYDNGQMELTKILVTLFNAFFHNVEYRQVKPAEYRLQQVADVICTLKLCELKAETKTLSKSELSFFRSGRDLKKNYLKQIMKKEFGSAE